MKIALNGQYITINNPAGPERFTLNLFKYLARTDKVNKYTIYFDTQPNNEFIEELFQGNPNINYKVIEKKYFWTQFYLALETWTNNYDIVFSPRHTYPILKNFYTKSIMMFHGLEYKTNKEFAPFSLMTFWHPFVIKMAALLVDLIVVPSKTTAEAISKEYFDGKMSKIKIINEGVDENFHPRSETMVKEVLAKYELNYKKYLLFVSTVQPRKNVAPLIESFARSLKENSEINDIKLVIVGKLGWGYKSVIEAPKKHDIESNIKFLNWVSQEDLYHLFSGAKGYVNFSLDEGFGLTVLEAMASEIPTTVSYIPAHKEVGENLISYANPTDINSMTEKINELIKDKYDITKLPEAKNRSKEFTWETTAKKLIMEFNSLVTH